jgi:hypothetical protein
MAGAVLKIVGVCLVIGACGAKSRPVALSPSAPPPRSRPATSTVVQSPPVVPAGLPQAAATLGPWRLTGRTEVIGPMSDQGLTTVDPPAAPSYLLYRGTWDVNKALKSGGWVHIGDPDSWHGWVVDAFQGPPGSGSKMFRVTSPSGQVTEAIHPLVPGEEVNNSFAAVSPDGQWIVSFEWNTSYRLLVFPTPVLNPFAGSAIHPSPLPIAGAIQLDHPVRDLQGCTFVTGVELLCASSDPASGLWPAPDPLLEINLAHPVRGLPGSATNLASVSDLGPIPGVGTCPGAYEPEGVDFDPATGILRIEVSQPGECGILTQVYAYHR